MYHRILLGLYFLAWQLSFGGGGSWPEESTRLLVGSSVLALIALQTGSLAGRVLAAAVVCLGTAPYRHMDGMQSIGVALVVTLLSARLGRVLLALCLARLILEECGLWTHLEGRLLRMGGLCPTLSVLRPFQVVAVGAALTIGKNWRWGAGVGAPYAAGNMLVAAAQMERDAAEGWLPWIPDAVGALIIALGATIEAPAWKHREYWKLVLLPVGAILLLQLVWCRVEGVESLQRPDLKGVAIVRNSGGTWDVPTRESYGPFSTGMLGLLSPSLRHDGVPVFEVTLDSEELAASQLDRSDLLIIINCPRKWTTGEREVIDAFMRAGGHVCVVGDHTNAFGLATSVNPLLQRYGAELRDDSAYPLRGEWRGNLLATFAGACVWQRRDLRTGLGWGIGASLAVDRSWQPLLVSRLAFSDKADHGNEMGNYLGNYAHESNEAFGSLVLAAYRPIGEGSLVLYGDSGLFQNGAILSGWRSHVWPAICAGKTLGKRKGGAWRLLLPTVALISMIRLSLVAWSLMLLLPCTLCERQFPARRDEVPSSWEVGKRVCFLRGFAKDGGFTRGDRSGGWSLTMGFSRKGWTVEHGSVSQLGISSCQAACLVAPLTTLGPGDSSLLIDWVAEGGDLIIVASGPSAKCMGSLLGHFGMRGGKLIVNYSSDETAAVQFVVPGRIEPDDGASSVVATIDEQAVVAWRRFAGGGRVFWICDSRFLADSNTESERGVVPGNVNLLEWIVDECSQERR